ncbi:arylamine N-acetyltransferase family protein [Halomonas cupida]|uniref:arylamine N-acetyltransferase family protein n=1 Tax=Halomonas cupida TaxID=44933 RepID=UPI003A9586B9
MTRLEEKEGREPHDVTIDLPAWLERIHYSGPLDPSVDLLETLVARHMAAIPFEAIDVLLHQGVDLSPAAIDRKMLQGQRGGYCLEHASLMRRALLALGYRVEQQLARVWIRRGPNDPVPPADHTMLKVLAGDQWWLVDVGFGAFMPDAPLVWRLNDVQKTAYGTFRLVDTTDGCMLETIYRDEWSPLYEILDFRWQAVDFEVANHHVAEHPESHFRHELMVARTEDETRYTLSGNRFRITRRGNVIEERLLDTHELGDVLGRHFGLSLRAEWQPMLERVAAQGGR